MIYTDLNKTIFIGIYNDLIKKHELKLFPKKIFYQSNHLIIDTKTKVNDLNGVQFIFIDSSLFSPGTNYLK